MYSKNLIFKLRILLSFLLLLLFSFGNIVSLSAHEKSVSGSKEFHGGDFILKSAEGRFSLKDLRGSVVLLFFGYTSCPNVCPISLATISNVFSQMSPTELKRTTALFISLDPEKDTLEILKQYTNYFNSNIVGLTDDIKTVIKVAEQYGVKYKKTLVPDSALGYVISHSDEIFVVGLDGKPQKTFPHDTDTAPLLAQIKQLLAVN
ncbi:MAG: SCO family protein [SAR324 cluster bacterium]|nr:SCO family protein [SAR324 cluster bacterium]MBL7035593.1 SCO family protein [SAR324 cluster bacterium]